MATARLAWEQLIATARALLPKPIREDVATDQSLVMTGGEPAEVMVRLNRHVVTVSEFAVRRQDPHGPTARPIRLGGLRWRRMSASRAMALLEQFIRTAQESRRSKYRRCWICEETKPPEQMYEDDVCQNCADRDPGGGTSSWPST